MGSSDTITIPAYAKLNLALGVGPPVPPKGYHPIASWFVAISLRDTLRLARLPDGAASSHAIRWATSADGSPAPRPTPIDWPLENDLAVRSHRLVERFVGRPLPVRMELIKRIPVGGGLGGGSSDGAAMLVGLNGLFGLGLDHHRLAALSADLGSDIAFFIDEPESPQGGPNGTDDPPARLAPRPALVTGFGDGIERIGAPPITDVLLLIPPFGCPTGGVYAAFDAGARGGRPVDEPRVRALIGLAASACPLDPSNLFNDLAEPACVAEPRLRDVLDRLAPLAPHRVHVTGSGSTMFLIPDPVAGAGIAEIAARAEALVPELVVLPCTTL